MLTRVLQLEKTSYRLARSFGGGKAFDPKFERDWETKNNKILYDKFMKEYDVGEARKEPKSNVRLTVGTFMTDRMSDSTKNYLVQSFAANFQNKKVERVSVDQFKAPKITENSVLVYHGADHSNQAVNMRWFDRWVLTLPLLTSPVPTMQAVGMGFMYAMWGRGFVYEPTRRLVLRMDLLPHIESVSILKVGNFGQVYNEIVRVQDLEKISRDQDYSTANTVYHFNRNWIDWDMTFINKKSGERYMFEERGLWDWQGVNHPLIA